LNNEKPSPKNNPRQERLFEYHSTWNNIPQPAFWIKNQFFLSKSDVWCHQTSLFDEKNCFLIKSGGQGTVKRPLPITNLAWLRLVALKEMVMTLERDGMDEGRVKTWWS
jgi:hypothetical protein